MNSSHRFHRLGCVLKLDPATNAQAVIHQAEGKLPEAKQITEEGLGQINNTVGYLTTAEEKLDELSPKIKADLKKSQ